MDLALKVKGLWLFRGPEIPQFLLDGWYDMELYDCKKVDITDNDQKERVNQMIEDQKPFKGKPLLVASASGKWTQLFPWLKVVFSCVVFPARVFPHTIANRPKSSLFVFVKLSHSMQKLCVVWKKRVNGRVFLIEWKRKWNGYKELCFYMYKLNLKEEKDQNRKTNYCTCLTNWSVD